MSGSPKPSKAADQAAQMEQERQAAIRETQGRVNAVFDNPRRARDISDFVSAVRSRALIDLDRQNADAQRELKFALARGGLSGGSVSVDQNRRLGDEYNRGLINVENRAQGAGSQLEAADQDARSRLIQLATSGLDATSAASQAASSLRSNIGNAQAQAYGEQLGDQFANVGAFVKQRREESARRQANRDANYNLYGGGAAYGG
ncbi:TPA: hypothetical protein ACOFC6_002271 [Stenotrophomonas maltophilia]|uniref:hypothetical protein n=1 Tax=Stenotrophomonas maltophilia TaxID=40324 RepID=UPI0013106E83|nr:hypothetical protein [Stenotrophomonas maltophilia]